jgi:transposase-like protein
MAERGLSVSQTAIPRWVIHYVPEFEKRWMTGFKSAGDAAITLSGIELAHRIRRLGCEYSTRERGSPTITPYTIGPLAPLVSFVVRRVASVLYQREDVRSQF